MVAVHAAPRVISQAALFIFHYTFFILLVAPFNYLTT